MVVVAVVAVVIAFLLFFVHVCFVGVVAVAPNFSLHLFDHVVISGTLLVVVTAVGDDEVAVVDIDVDDVTVTVVVCGCY